MSEVPIGPLEEEEPPDPFEPEEPISDGSEGEGPGPPDDPEMSIGWEDAEVSGDRINLFDAPIVAGEVDGKRVEMTDSGIRVYDEGGVETASLDGVLTLAKVDAGEGLEAKPNVQAGAPGLNFRMSGFEGGTPPQVIGFSANNAGGFAAGSLVLKSAEVYPNTSGRGEVRLQPNRVFIGMESGPDALNGLTLSEGDAQLASAGNASRVTAAATGAVELQSSGGATVTASSNGSAEIRSSGGAEVIVRPDGGVRINGADTSPVYVDAPGSFRILRAQSTNSYPNARIDPATGAVLLSTVDVAGIIADLEARIAALESA